MFYPEKIKSIKKGDKVLEIGPGGHPYFRSDIFLDRKFGDEKETVSQRAHAGELRTTKPIVYYEGGRFPFADKEFDYVVCSHVLEHVDDVEEFLRELTRVAKAGYLEFPTVYYDYVYNFKTHKNLLLHKNGVVRWLKKEASGLNNFFEVQKFFYESLVAGYDQLFIPLKKFFFQGFEWSGEIKFQKAEHVNDVCWSKEEYSRLGHGRVRAAKDFLFFYKLKEFMKYRLRILLDKFKL